MHHSKMTLVEKDEFKNDDAETLNSFFAKVVFNPKIPKYQISYIVIDESESNKNVDRIVRIYKNHPSVTAIKQAFPDLPFSFIPVVREVY